jgi:hypothetical protein
MTDIKDKERDHLLDKPDRDAESPSTLLPMLISGLVLIVIGMIAVVIVT